MQKDDTACRTLFQPSTLKRHQPRLISTSGFREATPHVEHGQCQWDKEAVPENKSFKPVQHVIMSPTCSSLALLNATNRHLFEFISTAGFRDVTPNVEHSQYQWGKFAV